MVSYNNKSTNSSWATFDGYIHDGPSRSVNAGTFISSGRITGTGEIALLNNVSSFGISPASKKTVQGDLTYYKSGFLGSHELQTGGYLQLLNGSDEILYPNNGFAAEDVVLRDPNNPGAGYVPYRRQILSIPTMKQDETAATEIGMYVQGAWKPTPRLTVNLGVRLDWIKATEEVFNVQLQKAWHVGPRLGATWVLTTDGKNVVWASYARVHEMPMPRNLGSVGSASATVTNYYDNNLDGVFETVLVTPIRFAGTTRGDKQISLRSLQLLNFKVGYNFHLAQDRQIQLGLDVFNIANRGAYEQWASNANQLYSPNYGLGRAQQFPRVFQASVRFVF
jgi:outer membrane receptor protein involved in Fe transport